MQIQDRVLMLEKDVRHLSDDVSDMQNIIRSLVKSQHEMNASLHTIKYIVALGLAFSAALAKFF